MQETELRFTVPSVWLLAIKKKRLEQKKVLGYVPSQTAWLLKVIKDAAEK